MAKEQTHHEVKENMVSIMGDDFGGLFFELRNEILTLSYKWIEYKELYGINSSRIDILNDSAPAFFYMVERILRENVILGITRLTDPPSMNGKKNITIKAVLDFLSEGDLKIGIKEKMDALIDSTKFCRDWRNRHIAHNDYSLKFDRQANPLQESTRKKIEEALIQIQDIFSEIYLKYFGGTVRFDALSSYNGAIALLHTLEDGLAYKEERREKGLPYFDRNRKSRI